MGLRQLDALAGSALDPEGAGACRRRLARARAALTGRGAGKTGRRRTRTGALRLRARLPSFTKVGTQFHSRSPPNVTKAATPSGRPDLRPLSVESRGPGIHDVGGCPAIGGSGSGRRECRSRYDATATAWRNGSHGFVERSPSSRTPTAGWRRRADLNCLPMVCHAVERATDRQREDSRSMLFWHHFVWRSGKDSNPQPADWKFRSRTVWRTRNETAPGTKSFAAVLAAMRQRMTRVVDSLGIARHDTRGCGISDFAETAGPNSSGTVREERDR